MRKTRFTGAQIAFTHRQTDEGVSVGEACHKMGWSDQTYFRWRKKYGLDYTIVTKT